MRRITLSGSYQGKPIEVGIKTCVAPTNAVTVFVHGLYGVFDANDKKNKINILAEKLVSEGVSHTVQYSSSRDFSFAGNADYALREKAFEEKTFEQELGDLKKVISHIFENSKELFSVSASEIFLFVHGNSLGGTLAILLEEFFPHIKKISLCGSGCGKNSGTQPILSTMFSEEMFFHSVERFTGELLLLRGKEDTIVPIESGRKIIKHAINARTRVIEVPGVNHNFSAVYGVDNEKAKQIFVKIIFDFLSKV